MAVLGELQICLPSVLQGFNNLVLCWTVQSEHRTESVSCVLLLLLRLSVSG